ncbi:Quinone oxidoreductase 2 [Paraconexibacter sp. AEG42_29]|uniref:Quinone oxidoreductase 2 n=1 Tax=Paraconexibacter sp. AEG42_29 TaxID=2997339 RepID=A0AAU7AP32_9ACTN
MSLIITGASGTLGRLTAEAVLTAHPGADLVLVTRSPDKLADLAARGAEVRAGDFDDPATLADAFAGGKRLLLISTDAVGARVAGHRAAIDAAVAAGVTAIAYTSVGNPSDSNPAAVAADHRATEDHLRASGVAWTFLRNSIYTEMLVDGARAALANGTYLVNEGDGATSHVARADCAAVAAAVLLATGDAHANKAYDVTGPAALTATERAAIFAEIGGRPVTATLVDDDAWVAAMVEHAGLPESAARLYATFGAAARLGYSGAVSTAVEDLVGRAPRSVRDVLAERL